MCRHDLGCLAMLGVLNPQRQTPSESCESCEPSLHREAAADVLVHTLSEVAKKHSFCNMTRLGLQVCVCVCVVIFELGELACSNFMYEDEESSAGGSHRLHRSTFGLKQ